ncbi:ribosomal RNA small subunit methyltransferase A-like [Oratosquilla oratoria]|uniref:ribosomal RNA small subunit methyltransferase A-like n=1 Tax=Oratosquilla oratoria TaxID=337810 RepID=UPI003F769C8D
MDDYDNDETSTIVEVGPGRGAITKPLVEKAKNVIAIEIDKDMIYILENTIPKKIMLQKELVDRIFAKKNTKQYGRLTVAIGSLFNLEKKINVPAGCFKPKPNVDSGFIVLTRRDINFDIDGYLKFIKAAFAMKRKTILNSLKKSNYENSELIVKYFENNNIKLNIRSEEIDIDTFIEMYKFIKENQD